MVALRVRKSCSYAQLSLYKNKFNKKCETTTSSIIKYYKKYNYKESKQNMNRIALHYIFFYHITFYTQKNSAKTYSCVSPFYNQFKSNKKKTLHKTRGKIYKIKLTAQIKLNTNKIYLIIEIPQPIAILDVGCSLK